MRSPSTQFSGQLRDYGMQWVPFHSFLDACAAALQNTAHTKVNTSKVDDAEMVNTSADPSSTGGEEGKGVEGCLYLAQCTILQNVGAADWTSAGQHHDGHQHDTAVPLAQQGGLAALASSFSLPPWLTNHVDRLDQVNLWMTTMYVGMYRGVQACVCVWPHSTPLHQLSLWCTCITTPSSPTITYIQHLPFSHFRIFIYTTPHNTQHPPYTNTPHRACSSSVHYDCYHNALCVVQGTKRVRLVAPSAAATAHMKPLGLYTENPNHAEVGVGGWVGGYGWVDVCVCVCVCSICVCMCFFWGGEGVVMSIIPVNNKESNISS